MMCLLEVSHREVVNDYEYPNCTVNVLNFERYSHTDLK